MTEFPTLPPRAEWKREHYVTALAKLRHKAASLRRRANEKDAEADKMRKDWAASSTDKLPLFQ